MDLICLEKELKKRWDYPYYWGKRQKDEWDKETNFIYKTYSFETLVSRLSHLDADLINYGLNRWYNFWSAMAVEYLFSTHPEVAPNKDKYDKLVDFRINSIPFDHKTSIFPKGLKQSYNFAKAHKEKTIEWLYNNQSQQGRKHLANRLFIILYDEKNGEHWKLKAEISLLKQAVDTYLDSFSADALAKTDDYWADLIWVVD